MARNPHEKTSKPETIDRREQSRRNKLNSIKPVKAGSPKLDRVGFKKG